MKTIRAIYEDGVFWPIGQVDLPEHCEVEFEPKAVAEPPGDAETSWQEGISREWAEPWDDPREDIYTLDDGEPIDDPR